MDDRNTEIGGVERALPTTSHSVLSSLRGTDPALERLVQLYWKPVYGLIRRTRAVSNEDAKDLTQDFFSDVVLGEGFAERYDRARGSFRAYLKGALRNFLANRSRDAGREKRGGATRIHSLSLPEADLHEILPDAQTLGPEEAFDRAWRDVVLARAARLLEERLKLEGKRTYFEVFRRHDLDPAVALTYESLSSDLGISADDVKNYLTRAREEFRIAVRSVICESVGSAEALSDEWNSLFGSP